MTAIHYTHCVANDTSRKAAYISNNFCTLTCSKSRLPAGLRAMLGIRLNCKGQTPSDRIQSCYFHSFLTYNLFSLINPKPFCLYHTLISGSHCLAKLSQCCLICSDGCESIHPLHNRGDHL